MGRPSACFCKPLVGDTPSLAQHSGQLSPVMLLPELCKGKKQWDFPSQTDWLQGLLGQPDVHQYSADRRD